jgi:hypothetical protein
MHNIWSKIRDEKNIEMGTRIEEVNTLMIDESGRKSRKGC